MSGTILSTLPYEKTVQGEETHYVLPVKDLGGLRWVGMFPVLFGLVFGGFAVFWILGAGGLFAGGLQWHPSTMLFMSFGLPFVLVGLGILRRGLLILLPSRCRLRITRKHLVVREEAWLLHATKRIARRRIGSFTVNTPAVALIERVGTLAAMSNGLKVNLTDGGDKLIFGGYTCAVLEPLAQDIAATMGRGVADVLRVASASAAAGQEPPVRVEYCDEENRPRYDFPARRGQPFGSKMVMAQTDETLTFLAPPMGFRGSARFDVMFGLVWTAFSGVGMVTSVHAAIVQPGRYDLMAVLMTGGFVLIGLVLLGVGLQLARARAVVLATRERLVYTLTGPFRKKELEAAADEILRIAPGPSGVENNSQPVLQLTVERHGGKPLGMLMGRREDELQWLATLLSDFYGLGSDQKE